MFRRTEPVRHGRALATCLADHAESFFFFFFFLLGPGMDKTEDTPLCAAVCIASSLCETFDVGLDVVQAWWNAECFGGSGRRDTEGVLVFK